MSSTPVFVSIPSYKDAYVVRTVRDCLERAATPSRVHIFVCEQNDDEPSCLVHLDYARSLGAALTVDSLPSREAQGPCYARARLERMMLRYWETSANYNTVEPFVFMIDAHTLFAPRWDELLEQDMRALPSNAVLSHYPKSYVRTSLGAQWNRDERRTLMAVRRKNSDGIYLFSYVLDDSRTRTPLLSKGLAAGCLVMRASVLYEVPYLKRVPYLFLGEEMCMWMRLFCAGYDVFTPSQDIVYTTFVREGRANFSASSRKNSNKFRLYQRSVQLIKYLMGLVPKESDQSSLDFFRENEPRILVRSQRQFLYMLDWMHRHRGPLAPEALPIAFTVPAGAAVA